MTDKRYDLAVVIHSLKIGGSERFTVNLVNGWVNQGNRLLLILLESDNPLLSLLDPRVEVRVLNRKFRYDLTLSFRIQQILSAHSVEKVFCVEPYSFFLTRLASTFRLDNRKYFLSLHHSAPIKVGKYVMDIFFLRWFKKKDHVFFICANQKICFREKYHFHPSKHTIIYNGIDTSFFSPEKIRCQLTALQRNWRQYFDIKDHEQVIVMVGRISPEKGQRYAIEALSILHKAFEIQAHLVIIGEGELALVRGLKERVNTFRLESYIHFADAQKEVRPFLLTSNLFTLTSVSETFSLAALEALSMGLPVSLTDVGGAKELIRHEQLGSLSRSMDPQSIAASWASILKRKSDRTFIRKWTIDHHREEDMVAAYVERLDLNQ